MLEKKDEAVLAAQRMEVQPAPLMVLEMLTRKCKRACKASASQHIRNELVCIYSCEHNAQNCHSLKTEPVRNLRMDDIDNEVAY